MKRSGPLRRRATLAPASSKRRLGRAALTSARAEVRGRAKGWCEIRVSGVCAGRGSQAHHKLRRSQGGPDVADNLAWTCEPCHRFVHANPEWAYALGWLLRRVA